MRIGLVIEHFGQGRGGREEWAARFVTRMASRGHDVHVAAGAFDETVDLMPVTPHTVKVSHGGIGFAEAASNVMRQTASDVVHDTGVGIDCDVFQPYMGSRMAAIERTSREYPRILRPLRRLAVALLPSFQESRRICGRQYVNDGRLFVAVSRRVAHDFTHLHRVPPERIRLVSPGVDTDRFTPDNRIRWRDEIRSRLGIQPRTIVLLLVARNFQLRGVVPTLAAVGQLLRLHRRVHLIVVGGTHLAPWQTLAQQAGAESAVTFAGEVDDPVPYHAAADIGLQPSIHDPCSLVTVEAMASGLPVVSSLGDGVSELITEGTEGYVVDNPNNIGELVTRIQALLDPTLRHRMAEAARRLAIRHNLDRNCQQMETIYQEARESRRRAA